MATVDATGFKKDNYSPTHLPTFRFEIRRKIYSFIQAEQHASLYAVENLDAHPFLLGSQLSSRGRGVKQP